MKTQEQIKHARNVLCETLKTPGLNPVQQSLFAGMLNALAWVCDSPNGSSLERLLAGEPVAAGKDPTVGLERLSSLQSIPPGPGGKGGTA